MERSYSVRLCVRIGKGLHSVTDVIAVTVAGKAVNIKSRYGGPPSDTDWIAFEASGFPSETVANDFGRTLQRIIQIAGICTGPSIDVGWDTQRSWMNPDYLRDTGHLQHHQSLGRDIHGLYVYPDDENIVFMPLRPAAGVVRASSDYFVGAIGALSDQRQISTLSDGLQSAIRLLNLAQINSARLARMLLAFAAIESLVHEDKWTTDEQRYLDKIVASVENNGIWLDDRSRERIARAIGSARPTGVTQGVVQLLQNLNLESLEREWKALYSKRSRVMHGDTLLNEADEGEFSKEAIQFATTVILSAIRTSGVILPSVAENRL